jgi:repressor LexA
VGRERSGEPTVAGSGGSDQNPSDQGPSEHSLGHTAQMHTFPDLEDGTGEGLTPRQRRVLEVIREWVERLGYPPSVREIGEAVGLTSTSSVAHQLRALERKGYLRRDPNRPRAVGHRPPGDG